MTRRSASPVLVLCILLLPTSLGVVNPLDVLQPGPTLGILSSPPPCHLVQTTTLLVGDVDNFVGIGPTTRSADFDSWLTGLNVTFRQFDDGGLDKHFGHTVKALPSNILSATLVVHVSAVGTSGSVNDGIHLQFIPGGGFHRPDTLLTASNGNWPSTTSVIIPFSPTLLSAVDADGYLDVYIQDDTMVDYMELTMRHCMCDGPLVVSQITQGTADNFVGAEPTTPRLPFTQWVGSPQRGYDEDGPNKDFATTLALPDRPCLLRAVLEVRLEAQSPLVTTDGIAFQYTGTIPEFEYNEPLAYSGVQTLTYNLGTLPGTSNFVNDMAAKGFLDVYIQDDSAVDYVSLELTYG